jgi:hypothetical protein
MFTKRDSYSWQSVILLSVFSGLVLLSPFGFVSGSFVIWATDILFVVLSLGLLVLFFRYRLLISRRSILLILYFCVPFVGFELFLPLIGNIDAFSTSSIGGVRIFLLWFLPVLLFLSRGDTYDLRLVLNVLKIFLAINFTLGILELLMYKGIVPEYYNYRLILSHLVVEDKLFDNRVMSFGTFQNSTDYALFGYLVMALFITEYLVRRIDFKYMLLFTGLGFSIVLMSTSRAVLFTSVLAYIYVLVVRMRSPIGMVSSVSVFAVLFSLGVWFFVFSGDELAWRVARIFEDGLMNDYSFNERFSNHWPSALSYYSLNGPTYVNPVGKVGVIDSGYLTLLLQGGIPMLASFFLMVFGIAFFSVYKILNHCYGYSFALLNILYLSIAMFISNPIRNELFIFFLIFSLFYPVLFRKYV